jgi:catechol 2,3-dioxygenase-like lactoylglutathione lyase family enzyme
VARAERQRLLTRYKDTGAPLLPLYTDEGRAVTFSGEWLPGTLTKAAIPAAAARAGRPQGGGYGYLRGPDGAKIEFQGDLPAERFNHVHMFQEDVFCAELWYQKHLNAPLSAAARRAEGRRTSEADCRVQMGEPSWLSLVPEGTKRTPAGGVVFDDVEMNSYQRQGNARLESSKGQVMDHVALSVADLDAWFQKLRRGGVKILEHPRRVGGTRAFMVEGPSRERIELVEVK